MPSTGSIFWDVQDDFRRARRRQLAARCGRLLTGRRCAQPRRMTASALPIGPVRRAIIDLDDIVGTVEVKRCFDDRLRPASNLPRHRWERVATAVRSGRPLPPIAVIRCPDGCYLIDGCHRVSVARAFRLGSIDAIVQQAIA